MHKLITILTTSSGHFAAEQHGQTFWVRRFQLRGGSHRLVARLCARPIVEMGLVARGALLLIGAFLLFLNRGVMYHMEIAQNDGELHYSEIDKGKVVSDSNLYLENISSADMQYRRQDARLVVILRDGRQVYPLGDDWVRQDPDQAVVLAAIRNALGVSPPSSSRP